MNSTFQIVRDLLFRTVIGPVVLLIFAAGLLYFLWGVVKYIWGGADVNERIKGRQHMIWGVLGLAIMLSAFGLAAFLYSSVASVTKSSDAPPTILQPGNQHF